MNKSDRSLAAKRLKMRKEELMKTTMLAIMLLGLALPAYASEVALQTPVLPAEVFRHYVEAVSQGKSRQQAQGMLESQVALLGADEQRKYRALEARCSAILGQQGATGSAAAAGVTAQSQGLGRGADRKRGGR